MNDPHYDPEERSTLRPRLLDAINGIRAQADRNRSRNAASPASIALDLAEALWLLELVEDPFALAAFDAWLYGPWQDVKDNLESAALRFAAGEFLRGVDNIEAWGMYRAIYLTAYAS